MVSDLEPERQVLSPALGQRAGQWGMAEVQRSRGLRLSQSRTAAGVGHILSPRSWAWLRGGQDRGHDTWQTTG